LHKLIVLGALAFTPLAIWIAGCRDNSRQAGFPRVSEMGRLAVSSSRENGRMPDIPAAIDPEVMNAPDQPTFARIRAVMDREAQLSSRDPRPGLFVIPRADFPELAALPSDVPAGREFRSRPVQPGIGHDYAPGDHVPADLSAMAAPDFPNIPGLPPSSASSLNSSLDSGPALPPVFDIPGIFTGGDAFEPLSLAPARPGGTPPIEKALKFPPPLTSAAFDPAALDHVAGAGKGRSAAAPAEEPDRIEWAVSKAAAEPAQTGSGRLAALFGANAVKLALTPLPDLSGEMRLSAGDASRSPVPAPPDMVETVSALTDDPGAIRRPASRGKLFETGNSRYMMEFWDNYPVAREFPAPADLPPLLGETPPASLDQAGQDDFENSFPTVLELLKALEPDPPAKGTATGSEPAKKPGTTLSGVDSAKPAGAPQKVALLPVPADSGRRIGARKQLEKIDNSIEAPPLVF
jgi:hypothetical protein